MSTLREPTVRVGVTVTFLRMDDPPAGPAVTWPSGAKVRVRPDIGVPEYRSLYDAVGEAHCWWLRRAMSDRDLAALLRSPSVSVHVLYRDGRPAGFHELDRSAWPVVNLNYFGLLPHAVGHGLGLPFLRHAVDESFSAGARAMTVNTCTADHPRALATYRRAGFRILREVPEIWQVPTRLGLRIPERLLAAD